MTITAEIVKTFLQASGGNPDPSAAQAHRSREEQKGGQSENMLSHIFSNIRGSDSPSSNKRNKFCWSLPLNRDIFSSG